jgi:hypothetical protein
MGVAASTKLIIGIIVVLAALVMYQVMGIGAQAEALANPGVPPGEISEALGQRMFRQVSLETPKPNLWIHLNTNQTLPFPGMSLLPSAQTSTTRIDKAPTFEQLCAYSVLFHNANDFNVVLITDNDLSLLLPGWNVNLSAVPDEARDAVRQVALIRIVYYYGGLLVPSTFAATAPFRKVISLPNAAPANQILAFATPSTGTNRSEEGGVHAPLFGPSAQFLYSAPLNQTVRQLINALSMKTGTQAQVSSFEDRAAMAMRRAMQDGKVQMLPGELIGTKDAEGQPVNIAEAISGFKRLPQSVGVLVSDRLFALRKYGWLTRESPRDILSGSTWIAAQLRAGAGH